MKVKKYFLFLLFFSISLQGAKSRELGHVLDLMKENKYGEANKQLERIIHNKKSKVNRSVAQYYRGESLRKMTHFPESLNAYEAALISSTDKKLKSYSILGMAESYKGMGEKMRAERLMLQVLVLYPTSEASKIIQKKYKRFYLKSLAKTREYEVDPIGVRE